VFWTGLVLWLVSLLFGQVTIDPANRVYNRSRSQCVWASLETIGRHWGLTQLYGLTVIHKYPSGPSEANSVLNSKGIKAYWGSQSSLHDWQSLENAINGWHWPAAVGIGGVHMLLIVGVSKEEITIIDNVGSKALKEQKLSRKDFDRQWDGWWIVIPNPKDLREK